MRRVVNLWRSSVGKKILMALTGAILVGFLLGHMAGNLKAFQGAESFNTYAEFLREVGYPLIPHHGLLWVARIVLLAAVGVHIWAAWSLTVASRRARGTIDYGKKDSLVFSYASRTMRWGGVLVAAFVVYHILHFTTGQAHSDFIAGDAYHNLVAGFQNPLVAGFYILTMAALAAHLYHGIWSAFQTLGLNHPRYNRFRRPLAAVLAVVTFVGFITVPIAVQVGILTL